MLQRTLLLLLVIFHKHFTDVLMPYRCIIALHNLISNKLSNRDAEKNEGKEKEEKKKKAIEESKKKKKEEEKAGAGDAKDTKERTKAPKTEVYFEPRVNRVINLFALCTIHRLVGSGKKMSNFTCSPRNGFILNRSINCSSFL
jgi:CRISPR/Cas system CMR subunit Cmr6 (Cas7 group RAMP superfamily)